MAPRRSGGSSSSSSSSSSLTCPGAFEYWPSQVNLAYYILFLIMFIGISFAMCVVRKRSGTGKKLIGPAYILSLLFAIVSLALDLVNLVMSECDYTRPDEYTNIVIASTVFYHLSCLGLLFVVLYQLNSMLRKRLDSLAKAIKAIVLVMIGIMGILYIAYIVLSCYIWYNSYYSYPEGDRDLVDSTQKVQTAVKALYLLCVLASTGLSALTVSALRRERLPGGDLIGWVFVLHTFMIIWAILAVVLAALNNTSLYIYLSISFALSYILTFFQALSFLVLLPIAKHVCWRDGDSVHQAYAPVMHNPQMYGAHAYHHEPPEFVPYNK